MKVLFETKFWKLKVHKNFAEENISYPPPPLQENNGPSLRV